MIDPEGLRQRSVVIVTGDTKVVANGIAARVVHAVVKERGSIPFEPRRGPSCFKPIRRR